MYIDVMSIQVFIVGILDMNKAILAFKDYYLDFEQVNNYIS